MNIYSLDKKTLLLLGGLLVMCLLLLTIAVSLLWQGASPSQKSLEKEEKQNLIQSLFSSDLHVTAVSPTTNTLLTPGKVYSFSVTFNKPLRLDAISVSLAEQTIPTDTTVQIKPLISQQGDKTVIITPPTPAKSYTAYVLKILQKNPSKQLFSDTFSTDSPIPSPLPQNNQQLKEYLPYETGTYALSYIKEQNLYVFNFIYNFNDPTDGQIQFENAKQNALLFIKSKGIDPNSVIIDWRFH